MARNKETLVLLLDVSPTMHPYLNTVAKAARNLVQRKMMSSKHDELGLVFFGTNDTDNELNHEIGGYENIVSYPIKVVDCSLAQQLDVLPQGSAPNDFVDAIVVGMDMIIKKLGSGKKGNRRICLITDAKSPIKEPDEGTKIEQVDSIASQMEEQGFKFDAIILQVNAKVHIKSETDKENEIILRRFSAKTQGEFLALDNPLEILAAVRPRAAPGTTLYRGDMEVTPAMKVKVWVYKKVAQEKFPSLKNYSDKAPGTDMSARHEVKLDVEYKSGEKANVTIPPSQRAKAYRYGTELIPIAPDVEEALKLKNEKGVKVIGFTRASNIPRHYYMKDTNAFVPEPGNTKSIIAISSLVRALEATEMVAVVRCIWRQGQAHVVLGVLSPNIGAEDSVADSFFFNIIPFAEDLREFGFASFSDMVAQQPSISQQQVARNLVMAFDLAPTHGRELLQPDRTVNPVLQRFYHFLHMKFQDGDAEAPPLYMELRNIIEPDSKLMSENESTIMQLLDVFTLTINPQKDKKSKQFWKDRALKEGADGALKEGADGDGHDDAVKSEISFDSLVLHKAESVGSINPVQDFEALLSRRDSDEWVSKAISGMKKIILDLLDSAYRGNTYQKAIDCLVALRKGCVIQEEPSEFNGFLSEMKAKCRGKRLNDFWDRVISTNLTLITKEETPDSDISPEEAAGFLRREEVKAEGNQEPVKEEIDEMEALLDEAI